MSVQFSFQPDFRPPLPEIEASKDFLEKRALYETVDDMLRASRLDEHFVSLAVAKAARESAATKPEDIKEAAEGKQDDTKSEYAVIVESGALNPKFLEHSFRAFRCGIVHCLEGKPALRKLSNQLADSRLLQWFCSIERFGGIKAPSKSTLDRYFNIVDKEDIEILITELLQLASGTPPDDLMEVSERLEGPSVLGLEEAIALDKIWFDGTCLKADIHFPVDWVLLIDATRTLMRATILIREAGLKNRMPQSPETFLREMNKLGIAMSQQRRQKQSKRTRKKILRKMKALIERIAKHARRHREILENTLGAGQQDTMSEGRARQILKRFDNVLEQLPKAQKQAHERIIGERQVKSSDKILSLYEHEVNVIVRGKPGREVEFGNNLWLGEQIDGVIVDWQLYQKNTSDVKMLVPGVERVQSRFEPGTPGQEQIDDEGSQATESKRVLRTICADRGIHSEANEQALAERGLESHLCPRQIARLREQMQDPDFAASQKRRSQTEARISIICRNFMGVPLRSKGFANRDQALHWAVLAHNLWVLARKRLTQEEEKRIKEQERARGSGGKQEAA
jgi:hypothetical protein